MIINGVELEIDFTDAEIVEKIELGSKEVYDKAEELRKQTGLSPAEGIRQECKILKDFLDYVLGDGTSRKLFGEKNSLQQCVKAFEVNYYVGIVMEKNNIVIFKQELVNIVLIG